MLPVFEGKDMTAQRKALTKILIEKTAPDDKRDLFLWDSRVPGFGVRLVSKVPVFSVRSRSIFPIGTHQNVEDDPGQDPAGAGSRAAAASIARHIAARLLAAVVRPPIANSL